MKIYVLMVLIATIAALAHFVPARSAPEPQA
jgi:hypothetical protein